MKVIAKVMDVEMRTIKEKECAEVSLKSGTSLFTAMLWNGEVKAGNHKNALAAVGKNVMVEVSAEIYNGRLNYSFGYQPNFSVVDKAMAKPL